MSLVNSVSYILLIKIGQREHIERLQSLGELYLNTVQYFREIDRDTVRGDNHECYSHLNQLDYIEIIQNGRVMGVSNDARMYVDSKKFSGNLYCLYGVQSNLYDFTKNVFNKVKIEKANYNFGDYSLIIRDVKKFSELVGVEIQKLGLKYLMQPIQYYDPKKYSGPLNPFKKSNQYQYQNEVRIFVENNSNDLIKIYLGDISDISNIIPTNQLDTLALKQI